MTDYGVVFIVGFAADGATVVAIVVPRTVAALAVVIVASVSANVAAYVLATHAPLFAAPSTSVVAIDGVAATLRLLMLPRPLLGERGCSCCWGR